MTEYPTYVDWGENIVQFWACVPSPEREAAIAMADTAIALALFQVKELVKAAFFLGGVEASELRWEVWQSNWSVQTETIEVEDVEVDVLLVNQDWMFTLAQAFVDGDVPRRPSTRCRQLNFPNTP